MLEIIKKYNNKKLLIGKLDCNLLWMEIYENDVFHQMINSYSTFSEGFDSAYNLTKYRNIKDYIEDSEQYIEKPLSTAAEGDFFIKDLHVSICIGLKTLTMIDKTFKLVDTKLFMKDEKQQLYKKGE